jgi:SRSO17 transposase
MASGYNSRRFRPRSETGRDAEELRRLRPALDQFLDHYAPLFGRSEARGHARRFVPGLLRGGDRRRVETIAEAIDGCVVRSLQQFITSAPWDADAVLAAVRRQGAAAGADPDAVLTVDETRFPKKGRLSVGVKRPYSGTLGRTENCQVGVFLGYHAATGHTLIDRRVFLPEEWAADCPRRAEAGVPDGVVFRTKPALALGLVADAGAAGVPFRWVTGDSVSGDSPTFCPGLRELGRWYVLDSSADARVGVTPPVVIPPGRKPARGRPTTRPRVATKPARVDAVVAGLPPTAWRRVTVAPGSQGPLIYEDAAIAVWFSEEGTPSGPERLLVRRSLGQNPEVKYHRTNAPPAVPLQTVAEVRAKRWSIEQDFQNGKSECGLDESATRGWVGWHHHPALSLLALGFLARQRDLAGGKNPGAEGARGAGRARGPARPAGVG